MIRLLLILCLVGTASATAKPKKAEGGLKALTAPACGIAGADSAACGPDEAANRLVKGARAKEAPYVAPKDQLDSNSRGIPCKISSDCPAGQFCSPHGFCGVTGALGKP